MIDRQELEAGLVAIARDFLAAHRLLRLVAEQHRAGTLRFQTVRALVGDDERAVLFRLKERSHTLFRSRAPEVVGSESLFDLAIGSLFHEAMKFRENFYQQDAYGPKVRALRASPLPEAAALLPEFEKILAGAAVRIDEALEEAETLLGQTTELFRVLLRAHCESGALTRFLIEREAVLADVFGDGLDELLRDVHGSAAAGFDHGARAYLRSGFFAEAAAAFDSATRRGDASAESLAMRCYADGMQAYLERRYADFMDGIEAWVERMPEAADHAFSGLAVSALSRLGRLTEPGEEALAHRAAGLAARITPAA